MKSSVSLSPRRSALVVALASAHLLAVAPNAWAQAAPPTPPSPSQNQPRNERRAAELEAEQLFERAAARMDLKDYEAASALLERSQALDPSSGTLLNLGECYEQRGLTASAHAAFEAARQLAVQTGRADRAEVAELRAKRLSPALRQLVVVPPSVPPPGFALTLDGKPLESSRYNQPLPLDPGTHQLQASADAHLTSRLTVSAPAPGTTTTVTIPPLLPVEGGAAAPARGVDTQRVVALASGVVGVAGIATGTIFGLRSGSKHRESDQHCGPTTCWDEKGVSLMEDARSAGNVSTVGFVVGGLACAAAAVLWFAPPFGKGMATQIGVGSGTLRVAGQW
jgi:hypothetical protein